MNPISLHLISFTQDLYWIPVLLPGSDCTLEHVPLLCLKFNWKNYESTGQWMKPRLPLRKFVLNKGPFQHAYKNLITSAGALHKAHLKEQRRHLIKDGHISHVKLFDDISSEIWLHRWMLQGIKGVNSKAGQKVWVCFDLMSTFVNTVAGAEALWSRPATQISSNAANI